MNERIRIKNSITNVGLKKKHLSEAKGNTKTC